MVKEGVPSPFGELDAYFRKNDQNSMVRTNGGHRHVLMVEGEWERGRHLVRMGNGDLKYWRVGKG